MKKSILTTTLAVSVAIASAAACATPIKDGVYTRTTVGHNAPVTVQVTIKDSKIADIRVLKDLESRGVGRYAMARLAKHMVETQSYAVDAVTGATFSSMAIKNAVRECVKEAGGDISYFGRKVDRYPHYNETIQTQVVVVGGGGAGLTAAIAAQQNGAKVVILEKLGYLGGTTNVNGGGFNAPDPKRQKPLGVEDSVEKFYTQTFEGGYKKGDPKLVHMMADRAYPTLEWMESLGVEFRDHVTTATGALWQRTHNGIKPKGAYYMDVFAEWIRQHADSISVITDANVKKLIKNANGRVIGVEAENHGRKIRVLADKGVVLATGGYGANIKMRQKYNTGMWKEVKLDESIDTLPIHASAQGDGIIMGQAVGAALTGMEDVQVHPNATGLKMGIMTRGRNLMFINQNGDRFVNEGATRDVLSKAVFKQPGKYYWLVVNKVRYPAPDWKDLSGLTINDMIAQNSVAVGQTLDELAQAIKVDPVKLKYAVDQYNQVVTGKIKQDYVGFKGGNREDKPMTEGPWYAQKNAPGVHHTMGGLKINTRAQVLDTKGKVIPGLYAAGEVTGGIHGGNRLGGNAVTDSFVFGREAGTNAATGR